MFRGTLARRAWEEAAIPLDIPEVVIERLPVYLRVLDRLQRNGHSVISSQDLGEELGVTPAQIRKDLSYFGRFGKQGRGYSIQRLIGELRQILGLERRWSMALVGAGQLGRAIASYRGFGPQGFDLAAIFDASPAVVGTTVAGHTVEHVDSMEDRLRERPVEIGIVAVPAEHAQAVIDQLVGAGVHAILNYAPRAVQVPGHVRVRQIDPAAALQSMTYYLKSEEPALRAPR
ncbi:MAG: redox-sensing transcriptional repressor Rex [Chloroflexi bacterium]|nr:redox-sensing transcriptional repressor Rex [Chloroflexota bacterium]